jgi:hypothetical protein
MSLWSYFMSWSCSRCRGCWTFCSRAPTQEKPCDLVGMTNSYFTVFFLFHACYLILCFVKTMPIMIWSCFCMMVCNLVRIKPASPARLVKLNKILSPVQENPDHKMGLGLEMHVGLSMWVLSCFDPIRSELAIPRRGTIVRVHCP